MMALLDSLELLSSGADKTVAALQWGVVIGASLVAAVFDLRARRIPNAITAPLLVAGLMRAFWIGGFSGFADALGACVLLALPYVVLFVLANGGAGDAKLMGAIGAWLGLAQGMIVLFSVAIAGIILGLAKAVLQKRLRFALTDVIVSLYGFVLFLVGFRSGRYMVHQAGVDQSCGFNVPYGVAIFAGVCAGGGFYWLW